ncbi:HK97 family phage prohead protease [Qipengyuania citrea]|uniref:HK97 family phage prohead protease n=1 Tax=Qipengyuania citrea TaxID=225971 RepID=UPI001E44C720|nr:HK97 family phage prohead protease [Qipengyuania citrea]MCD1591804.1 HK97 family phage prohead protease [Qipengyuania citrea]
MTIEKKALESIECKLSSVDEADGKMTFTGYGAVFGNVDSYGDVIANGAFAKSIKKHTKDGSAPLMFLNHDAFGSLPIGKWTGIEEDETGLKLTGELLDTTMGIDTYKALKAGAITGLSIGFRPTKWRMGQKSGEPRRTLEEVELVEVSVVSVPANDKARVSDVKSFAEHDMTTRDLENLLRECGLTKSQATTVAGQFESKAEVQTKADEQDTLERVEALLSKFKI